MFYAYPQDEKTFAIESQYLYGNGILVAPVWEENATSVDVYLPKDVFYNWYDYKKVQGQGSTITVTDQGLTDIPLYIRGGVILPLRINSTMTTTELREQDFELIVPIGADGTAQGQLYMDDGVSIEQKGTTMIEFSYSKGVLTANGTFGYSTTNKIVKITILGLGSGCTSKTRKLKVRGAEETPVTKDANSVSFEVNKPLTAEFSVQLQSS